MRRQTEKRSVFYRMLFLFLLGVTSVRASAAGEFAGELQPFVFNARPVAAPTVPFFDADGAAVRLADYRGQVVLVNLWTTWCGACLHEMPALHALQQSMAGMGLQVLTLNQDLADGAAVRRFLDSRGFTALTAHRDLQMRFGNAVGQTLLPMTLLFDAKGQGIGHLVGPAEWNSAAAKRFISHYLPAAERLSGPHQGGRKQNPPLINVD